MSQLKRIITKAENCFQRCVIELRKTRGSAGIPIDFYLNTCLDCVEMVNPYWKPTKKAKVKTLPKEDYPAMMHEYEERRLDDARLTMAEFHEEMEQEKREVLHDLRKLRENSNPNKRRVPIM